MKVCYFIQTHKNPEQIYRLVNVIKKSSPNSYVLVSHNYNSCYLDSTPLENLSGVKVISNYVRLADFSVVQAYFDAIQWLFDNNIEFDWLINLTGQDYPTQPLSKFEKIFANTSFDGFIEYFEALSPDTPWGSKKGYERYYYDYIHLRDDLPPSKKTIIKIIKKIINNCQQFVRIELAYGLTIGFKSESHPFTEDFVCYGGSYYTNISRKCAEYLKDFTSKRPDVFNHYKKTFIAGESILQSILVNSKLFKLSKNTYRYIDFYNSRYGHPRLLTSEDFTAITKEDVYFARKFDMTQDSKILDLLDERIFAVEATTKN